jgi:hypothetical protein
MSYPDTLIRGVSDSTSMDEEGRAIAPLFQSKENTERTDEWSEISINWTDDDLALHLIFKQKNLRNPTNFQFKYGAAILSRAQLDIVKQREMWRGLLDYERDRKPDNKYHGNILIQSSLKPAVKSALQGCIAVMCVERIEKNPNITPNN